MSDLQIDGIVGKWTEWFCGVVYSDVDSPSYSLFDFFSSVLRFFAHFNPQALHNLKIFN